jgi:hypothetical protein
MLDIIVGTCIMSRMMKKVKINKSDVGRWVTVKWDDVGKRDGILISVNMPSAKVFEPFGAIQDIELNQIIEKRDFVNAQ